MGGSVLDNEARSWKCGKCGEDLKKKKTLFNYLGHTFSYEVDRCPKCGNVFIPKELAGGPDGRGGSPDGGQIGVPDIRPLLAPDLYERLQRSLIHEDDIRHVIAGCEETGVKLLDSKTGAFIGHRRRGR
jgi:ribosomal protein S27AE